MTGSNDAERTAIAAIRDADPARILTSPDGYALTVGRLCELALQSTKQESSALGNAQCATFPFPNDPGYWRARALKAEAELAVLKAQSETPRGETAKERELEAKLKEAKEWEDAALSCIGSALQRLQELGDKSFSFQVPTPPKRKDLLGQDVIGTHGGCAESEEKPMTNLGKLLHEAIDRGYGSKEKNGEGPTPRTDALVKRLMDKGIPSAALMSDLARQLERELAEAEERVEHMNGQHHDLCQQLAELEAAQSATTAIPEGCTPTDAMVLREANAKLAEENHQLRRGLRFYANGSHYNGLINWEGPSGDDNWLCPPCDDPLCADERQEFLNKLDEAMVEDGSLAKSVLMGHSLQVEDPEDEPKVVEGEPEWHIEQAALDGRKGG